MKPKQNLFIIPFTTEEDYRNNVFKILTLLKNNLKQDEVILTEGESSYTNKVHDVYEYSKIFDLPHRYNSSIQWSIDAIHFKNYTDEDYKHYPYKKLKYIVCIGTWDHGMVNFGFAGQNPDINIIHIQGPIDSKYYKVDNLEKFEIDVNNLSDILTFNH